MAGLSQGGLKPPQFLADQLTLSQPGGHILPTQYYEPPRIQTLRRPCMVYYYPIFFRRTLASRLLASTTAWTVKILCGNTVFP